MTKQQAAGAGAARFEWRKMSDIEAGDYVLWWGQYTKVIRNEEFPSGYRLTVYDNVLEKEQTFTYKKSDEVRVAVGVEQ